MQVDLPDFASSQLMSLCWEMLVEKYALKQGLDTDALRNAEQLVGLSCQTPAMLCYLVDVWVGERYPPNLQVFVLGHIKEKLLVEVRFGELDQLLTFDGL